MSRVIVTSVGTSLLEKGREWKILCNDKGRFPLSLWNGWFEKYEKGFLQQALGTSRDVEAYEKFGDLQNLARNCAEGIVELMRAVWSSDLDPKGSKNKPGKREASSAELASLNTLQITSEDVLVLLYSDTPEGAFCATCLEEIFRRGIAIGDEATPEIKPRIKKEKIAGLHPKEKQDFEQKAVGNLAGVIAACFYDEARSNNQQFVLNVTGGFKASIPTLTFIAGLSKKQEWGQTTVRLCCLYEEATELLWQPLIPCIVEPEPARDRLFHAGDGTANDPCGNFLWDNLRPEEKPYYMHTDPLELSSLGRAVREVLRVQDKDKNRQVSA